MMSGLDSGLLLEQLQILEKFSVHDLRNQSRRVVRDYDVDDFSLKVVRILSSYVGYVNRVIWSKPSI